MEFTKSKNGTVRLDHILYQIGSIIWIPVIIAGIWFQLRGYEALGTMLTCPIRTSTGIPCPGCGGTRALYFAFRGDIKTSIIYNASVIYMVFAYTHFMIRYTYRKYLKRNIEVKEIIVERYAYLLIVVILGQWFVKIVQYIMELVVR